MNWRLLLLGAWIAVGAGIGVAAAQNDRYSAWAFVSVDAPGAVTPPPTPPPPSPSTDLALLRALRDALNMVLGDVGTLVPPLPPPPPAPPPPALDMHGPFTDEAGHVVTLSDHDETFIDGFRDETQAHGVRLYQQQDASGRPVGAVYLLGLDAHWYRRSAWERSWSDIYPTRPPGVTP